MTEVVITASTGQLTEEEFEKHYNGDPRYKIKRGDNCWMLIDLEFDKQGSCPIGFYRDINDAAHSIVAIRIKNPLPEAEKPTPKTFLGNTNTPLLVRHQVRWPFDRSVPARLILRRGSVITMGMLNNYDRNFGYDEFLQWFESGAVEPIYPEDEPTEEIPSQRLVPRNPPQP